MSNDAVNPAEHTEVGEIGNYYGGLNIAEHEGRFYWGIENWNGFYWEEIPESLYRALVEFNESKQDAPK